MGNTCASLHAYFSGSVGDAAQAVSRTYTKLGYERVKKAGDKNVVVRRSGQYFLSVYDSDNAHLDNGELKQIALALSKSLKGIALVTSLYDSDTFEFVVFDRGKQVDLLMTDLDSYSGPLQSLPEKTRAQKWTKMIGRTITNDDIQNACRESVFADDIINRLAGLFSLAEGQCQINFQNLKDGDDGDIVAQYSFQKSKQIESPVCYGVARFRDYFDQDNSFAQLLYPSGFPIALKEAQGFPWLLISEGAGFDDGKIAVRLTGPKGLELTEVFVKGVKFHNGQIVGDLETAQPVKTVEEAAVARARHTFVPAIVSCTESPDGKYVSELVVEFSDLKIPSAGPPRTTQILLLVQPRFIASVCGDWDLQLSITPALGESKDTLCHHMPNLRLVAVDQKWLPVVSALCPGTVYDTAGLGDGRTGAAMVSEFQHAQKRVVDYRSLDFPAVLSNVIILREHDEVFAACDEYITGWLDRIDAPDDWELLVSTEKEMTAAGSITKNRKSIPVKDFRIDKSWRKLFDPGSKLQTVKIHAHSSKSLIPYAGFGYQRSMSSPAINDYCAFGLKKTLSKMRGREFENLSDASALHLYNWVLNHQEPISSLGASAEVMQKHLDEFVSHAPVLQAWHAGMTWIPLFDCGDQWSTTLYESYSVLNWFRGICGDDGGLHRFKMLDGWCSNVLRMVSPHMWISSSLFEQIDRELLEKVADLQTTSGGLTRILLRPGCDIRALELALLPILPVESVRLRKV